MLKLKKLTTIIISIILIIGIGTNFSEAYNGENNTRTIWSIDTNLDGTIYRENGLTIQGWILSTQANSKLEVYINDKKLDDSYIKYSRKYDLISIIQGYGTYEENPLPNFDIKIPVEEFDIGTYELEIRHVTEDGQTILQKMEKEIYVTRNIKHILSIDTKLQGQTFDKNGITIEGWRLSTEPNTKLQIKIDGQPVEFTQKDMLLYDLISIIQGYGTYKENPLPNYKIHIPTENLTDGKHKLEIEFLTANDELLERQEKEIIIEKVRHMLSIDTKLQGQVFDKNGITIEGWRLSTEPNTKLQIKIDGQPVEFTQKDMLLYDLISIIQGYGTYEENPLPNYKIHIPTENLTDGKHKLEIEFLTANDELLERQEKEIIIEKIRHMLNIDTKLQGQTFDKYGIEIEGWRLATEPNTKLQIEIDGQPVEFTQEDMLIYDLISIIQGYGTYEENPLPNYKIHIPTVNIQDGYHTIAIKFTTINGDILEKYEYGINVDKSLKHYLSIDSQLENTAWYPNGIQIKGWKAATEPNTKLDIYIDDRKLENVDIQCGYYYDLFSIVKGYGRYEDNPAPIFTINIPVTEFSASNHTLKIRFTTQNGTLLEEVQYNLVEYKSILKIEYPSDRGSIIADVEAISGWALTTMPGTELRLMIDGVYLDETAIRIQRQDILDSVHGYGGAEITPLPGYYFHVDSEKISYGLHQLVVRIEKDGRVLDGQIHYIFVNPKPRFEQGTYGKSGLAVAGDSRGSDLIYYRIGTGPNVLFATFGVHGFEDEWDKDGAELTYIAEQFKNTLLANQDQELEKEWTIYILPCVNPDGQKYGWTKDGPGRTTLFSAAPGNKGVDINRCWSTNFEAQENDRNYTGSEPFLAYEARYLRDFLLANRSKKGQTVLVDLHGWLNQSIGDEEIGKYYRQQLGITKPHTYTYGKGYLVGWAKENLGNSNYAARSSLIELVPVSSHKQVLSKKYAEKYITATINMLKGII